jgi:hypothetical protein
LTENSTLKQLQIVLIFSYIGMNTKELKATVSPMSVKLEGSETNLEDDNHCTRKKRENKLLDMLLAK